MSDRQLTFATWVSKKPALERGARRLSRDGRQLALPFDRPPIDPPLAPVAGVAAPANATAVEPDEASARATIARALLERLGTDVDVALTANRRTMISTRRRQGRLELRLHRMFVHADAQVLEALGLYLQSGDRSASRRLGAFIAAQRERFAAARRPRALRSIGAHHDLDAIFARIEQRFFPGLLEGVGITWGKHGAPKRGRRRKRTIRLGTYTREEKLIRVHPVLDQTWVPAFFVDYIVFHEMLHHVEPAKERGGRTYFHTPEFRRREREYPDYGRAIAWEKAYLSRLLLAP